MQLHDFERAIRNDDKLLFTFLSYFLVVIIYLNISTTHSVAIGFASMTLYLLINGVFMAHVFFNGEPGFIRLPCGILFFVMLQSLVSWLVMIVHNLDIVMSVLALLVAATLSSVLNRRMKQRNAFQFPKE